jgi:hypothetical protein
MAVQSTYLLIKLIFLSAVSVLKIIVMRLFKWCKSADPYVCHGDECCKACGMFCLSLLIPSRLDSVDSAHAEMRSSLLEDTCES